MTPDHTEVEPLLGRLAEEVRKRGLGAPAIFLLELYKPFVTLFRTASEVSMPLLVPLFGVAGSRKLMSVLESRDNFERLIRLIEEGEER